MISILEATYRFIEMPLLICRWVGFLVVLAFLSGCSLENDLPYIPETQAVFAVVLPEANQSPVLYQIEDSVAFPFGPSNNAEVVETLSGNGNLIGMTSAELKRVWIYDADTDNFTEWMPPDSFIPHSLSMGLTTMMVCDSQHNRIIFLNPETLEIQSQKQIIQPSLPFYRSGKFFVISAADTLVSFQESAFAEIGKTFVGIAVADIYADARAFIYLTQKDGADYVETIINFNSQQILQLARPVNYIKRRATPFIRASFGKELINDISLGVDGNITRNVSGQDFEVDFLEADLYYIENDSLKRYNFFTEQRTDFFIPAIKIISYFSYTDPVRP